MKKIVVISGVNLVEGGTLTVFKDSISEFLNKKDISLYILCHNKELLNDLDMSNATVFEFPKVKSSWLKRIYFEYVTSFFISRKIKPDIWLSMHDICPFVSCKNVFVYCHNPSPFYKSTIFDWKYDKRFYFFTKLYHLVYRINSLMNCKLIVQQEWLADSFKKQYGANDIFISRPELRSTSNIVCSPHSTSTVTFFYPSLVRTFKNFELILKAFERLHSQNNSLDIRLIVTFCADDGQYAYDLYNTYKHAQNIKFSGRLSLSEVHELYKTNPVLIFPSKLETWGLPMSEAKSYGCRILASALPFAYETISDYDKVSFFDPDDVAGLMKIIEEVAGGNHKFQGNKMLFDNNYTITESWADFYSFILDCTPTR